MIAMFMSKQHAVELFQSYPALLEAKSDLSCAKAAVYQDSAMIRGDERAVPGTAAPEHRQTEHAGI